MISKGEVEHIAKLARLELTEKEVEKMQKDLSAILDYFNLLKKAPSPAKILSEQNLDGQARKDEVKLRDASLAEKLIAAAPDKKDNYIKVRTIL
jgi:aspartyl/glutamyl-tRNA(Asn/Gln) amidotransferase C subunit